MRIGEIVENLIRMRDWNELSNLEDEAVCAACNIIKRLPGMMEEETAKEAMWDFKAKSMAGNDAKKLIMDLKGYAAAYRRPPYGREIDGAPELLEKAASVLEKASSCIARIKARYMDGMPVHYQGDDADDGIECPVCGYEAARNDDYDGMKPKHCPECGTKLIY